MKPQKVGYIILLFCILLAVFSAPSFIGQNQTAQAAELIKSATQQMVIPKPGQIAHYKYRVYYRVPPASLEPTDPYHLPYSEIWHEWQTEESWLEIGANGKITRWRVQLHSASGELLQDLVFDGQKEIDYFPALERIDTLTGKTGSNFIDDRVALFNDFLNKGNLNQHDSFSVDGTKVKSVYLASKRLESTRGAEEELLNFQDPFLADLKPISISTRIDFDRAAFVAKGVAQVVFDLSGQEHIVSYRSFADPEILSSNDPRIERLFELDLPAEIVANNNLG